MGEALLTHKLVGERLELAAGGSWTANHAGELEALDPEVLAVVLELDTIEDLPVIANLELLERLIAAEAS